MLFQAFKTYEKIYVNLQREWMCLLNQTYNASYLQTANFRDHMYSNTAIEVNSNWWISIQRKNDGI